MTDLRNAALDALRHTGATVDTDGGALEARTPLTGSVLGRLPSATAEEAAAAVDRAAAAWPEWAATPAPGRGDVVRRLGEQLRQHRDALADLITIEVGKIPSEAHGEVQEMIDVCDMAVGMSRQLHGLTMPSERPGHVLRETYQPLGPIAVVSAFNFPAAVWAWNAAIALICGDTVVWKPSELTPLTAVACHRLLAEVLAQSGQPDVHQLLLTADRDAAAPLLDDHRVRLVSATGSTAMGAHLGARVQRRFGRTLLELGGNNATVVTPAADLDLAVRGIVFSAAGTSGQRCTTLRRLIVHRSVQPEVTDRVVDAYRQLVVGNPWRSGDVHVGPLINDRAAAAMQAAIAAATDDGGAVVVGGERVDEGSGGCYVRPAVVTMPHQTPIVRAETFAPLLYVLPYEDLDHAIAITNDVPQGLACSIFTRDVREAERFIGPLGGDCGIVNVNVGPSGAEVGGAFGGEKATGGGRETGSDAWKQYMRRVTTTVNHSDELPLAQGVQF